MPKNPQGNWGPYGGRKVAFHPYAWAKVDAGGSILEQSGNLTILKGSVGLYLLTPVDNLTEAQVLASAISNQGAPVLFAYTYGLGPDSRSIQVSAFVAGVATDEDFEFKLYTTN